MGFLRDVFKRQIEKPFKQLAPLTALWEELVPAPLRTHTRLESFARGVLLVSVDSSSHLYELDRMLRGGLQHTLVARHKGQAVRKIQLRVQG